MQATAEPPFPSDRHPKIAAIHGYWLSVHPEDGGLPSRADIDPLDMPRGVLPNIWLIDVLRMPALRYRYRLIGTHVAKARDCDRTGHFVDEEFPDFNTSHSYRALELLVRNRLPSWRRGETDQKHRQNAILSLERIFLPLAGRDTAEVEMILALTVYSLPTGREL
jgi:hypothetical protein